MNICELLSKVDSGQTLKNIYIYICASYSAQVFPVCDPQRQQWLQGRHHKQIRVHCRAAQYNQSTSFFFYPPIFDSDVPHNTSIGKETERN